MEFTNSEPPTAVPPLFGATSNLVYFHSHTCTPGVMDDATAACPLFEIDLAWAHSAFHDNVTKGCPFIGHPEEFYTKLGEEEYPDENVTLDTFVAFINKNKNLKLFIDIKDESLYKGTNTVLVDLINTVGPSRVICHAFIEAWRVKIPGAPELPHWYRENVDLYALDVVLSALDVPLIANCQANSNDFLTHSNIITMINDAKKCKSVVSIGLYMKDGNHIPQLEFLQAINNSGFWAWVNGNNCALEDYSCCRPPVSGPEEGGGEEGLAKDDDIEGGVEGSDIDDDIEGSELGIAGDVRTSIPLSKSFKLLYNVLDRADAWDKELKSTAQSHDEQRKVTSVNQSHKVTDQVTSATSNVWKTVRLITMSDRVERCTRFTRQASIMLSNSNSSSSSSLRGLKKESALKRQSSSWNFLCVLDEDDDDNEGGRGGGGNDRGILLKCRSDSDGSSNFF